MAEIGTVSVNAEESLRQVQMKIRVTHYQRMRVRLWLAIRLIQLAALVSGMGIQVASHHAQPESRRERDDLRVEQHESRRNQGPTE
ncbi:MAG TPA: hypothetical protein VFD70_18645 [Anaerolineae bacterium]|nr:hypothetical protein [Anaerolineae bacterium]